MAAEGQMLSSDIEQCAVSCGEVRRVISGDSSYRNGQGS